MQILWAKLLGAFWYVSLFLWVIFFELLSFYPFYIPNMAVVRPCLALVAVYYFAIYASWHFGVIMAFIAGLLADMLFMVPMGTYALVFLIVFQVAAVLRKSLIDKSFLVVWLGFATICLITNIMAWIMVAIVAGRFTAVAPMIISYLLLVALYPLMSILCYLALKLLTKAKRYE